MSLLRALLLLVVCATAAQAQVFETKARAAYVFDQTTGTVLMAKNADEALPPASMSKLMTIYMTFEAIADGRLTADTVLPVSDHAASFGGSTMFLDTTDRVSVESLLRGVIVLSGNDASVVLAEGLAGSETAFAQMMNDRAAELGMTNSNFVNSSGWPARGHVMSMRDLGILADRIISDFPTFYPLFAEESYAFDGRAPANTRNRNPLLGLNIGADGLKTGHTQEAGFGLVGSAKQGDRRVIFVITGLDTAAERADEAERLVNWAFRQFAQRTVAAEGTRVAEAEVWMGEAASVGLTVQEDVNLLVPVRDIDGVTAEAVFNAPVQAPISKGQQLGELIIQLDGLPEARVPLVADSAVPEGGFGVRMRAAAAIVMDRLRGAADAPT